MYLGHKVFMPLVWILFIYLLKMQLKQNRTAKEVTEENIKLLLGEIDRINTSFSI